MAEKAKKEGLTLKAFILKRCLGIKPEQKEPKVKKELAPRKPRAAKEARPSA